MLSPAWLVDDMRRIEGLLLETAGGSTSRVVGEASTHLMRAGGKRVRPALVLTTSRVGETGRRSTDLAAAAVELVHLATLYHDDVIDETDTRRGVPTVHAKWGIDVAVLAGDYLFARGCTLGADAGGEVPGILARAIAEVCEGQIAETTTLGNARRTVGEYLETIRRKTAALFRAACELGAATSGAPPEQRIALMAYGENLGMAFQIVDDLLDLVGDSEVTGKVPGTDLSAGVFTLPVLIACESEPTLVEGRGTAGGRELDVVLPLLEQTGALEAALQRAHACEARALEALEALPPGGWRDALENAARSVLAQVPQRA